MARKGYLLGILILILVVGVILRVRSTVTMVQLSMDDLAKQINQGNVTGLDISENSIFVIYPDAQAIGAVDRKGSLPVIQQLHDLGVTDEGIARLTITYEQPRNPLITLAVIAVIAAFVLLSLVGVARWLQQRVKPKA